jgi:hypothetical protein
MHHDDESEAGRRNRLRDHNTRSLYELLARRDELRGVHPMADLVYETFAWTV